MKLNYIKTLFVAILVIFATTTNAETYSGTCGTNVNWSLDTSTGLLKITGTGEMNNSCPWESYDSSIKSVEIAEGVTSIGDYAFSGCSGLTSVTIPNSVTSIGHWAFSWCSGLTSLTIPNSVTYIGVYAFEWTPWYNNQPDGLIYIGNVLYNYKGVMPDIINIKEGTISIGGNGLSYCDLTSVTIPNSVTTIGNDVFSFCKNLTSVNIPESVTSIGRNAFGNCTGLTSITIPNSVTSIGNYAFGTCTKLASITIGNSVSIIGGEAFMNCENLSEIYSLNPEPAYFDYFAFLNVDTTIPVYIPIGSISKYKSAEGWNEFTNFIESDFTGIEDSNISTTEIKVIAGNGIDICNYYGKLQVISLAGQVIKEITVNGSAQITLPKGAYIIVTENKSQKIVL